MPRPKRPQSTSDLEQQLAIQLGSLERNCGAYDEGAEDAILDIATRLRVLLHDTAMSLSLLGQLGIKTSLQFYDLSLTIPDLDPRLQMGETILAWTTTFPTPRYVAILDHGPPPKKLSFGEWWEASCLMMHPAGQKLGRKELILTVSNQDGGAHVDSGIDEDYAFFKDDAVIHLYRKGNGEFKPIPGKTGASVRQVAHEVLKSCLLYTSDAADEEDSVDL